jgi:hypothetical protein
MFKVQGAGCWVQGEGSWVLGAGFWVVVAGIGVDFRPERPKGNSAGRSPA